MGSVWKQMVADRMGAGGIKATPMERPEIVLLHPEAIWVERMAHEMRAFGWQPSVFSEPKRALEFVKDRQVAGLFCAAELPTLTSDQFLDQLFTLCPDLKSKTFLLCEKGHVSPHVEEGSVCAVPEPVSGRDLKKVFDKA